MKEQKIIQVSTELTVFMMYHQIPTLIILLEIPDEDLLEMEGFGWRLLKEVLQFRKV